MTLAPMCDDRIVVYPPLFLMAKFFSQKILTHFIGEDINYPVFFDFLVKLQNISEGYNEAYETSFSRCSYDRLKGIGRKGYNMVLYFQSRCFDDFLFFLLTLLQ